MATKRLSIPGCSFVFVCALANCLVAQSNCQIPMPARPNDSVEQLPPSRATAKAYGSTEQAEQALAYAQKLAVLNQQVPLPRDDMTALKAALQGRLESGIAAIKSELDYRNGIVELRSITGQEQ